MFGTRSWFSPQTRFPLFASTTKLCSSLLYLGVSVKSLILCYPAFKSVRPSVTIEIDRKRLWSLGCYRYTSTGSTNYRLFFGVKSFTFDRHCYLLEVICYTVFAVYLFFFPPKIRHSFQVMCQVFFHQVSLKFFDVLGIFSRRWMFGIKCLFSVHDSWTFRAS